MRNLLVLGNPLKEAEMVIVISVMNLEKMTFKKHPVLKLIISKVKNGENLTWTMILLNNQIMKTMAILSSLARLILMIFSYINVNNVKNNFYQREVWPSMFASTQRAATTQLHKRHHPVHPLLLLNLPQTMTLRTQHIVNCVINLLN